MKKHDKEAVIKIGKELLTTQGYHKTGTEEVLQKSDYPRSSFYYNFKSKEGFTLEVLKHYGDQLQEYCAGILTDTTLVPLDRLKKFYIGQLMYHEKSGFQENCLINTLVVEVGAENEALRLASKEELEKVLSLAESCVAEGQERGEITADKSAKDIASYIQSTMYGAILLAKTQLDNKTPLDVMNFALNSIKI